MKIRIATRKSALALWQAKYVADLLESLPQVTATQLLPLSTRGDEILDRSLQKIGGKGLFIKELEVAMQRGEADLAVHSMKDVPADLPDGFCIAATLARANHRDALISADNVQLADLPHRARIGSSSLRRQAQLKMLRSDLNIVPLRGNVNTRLQKLADGDYDAIILAAAGLERLGLAQHISHQFTADEMLPAAAQGVLGIECLVGNSRLCDILAPLNDTPTAQTTAAERAIARVLQASCQSPVAAYASLSEEISSDEPSMDLTALVAHPDGSPSLLRTIRGNVTAAADLGKALGATLLDSGARELLDSIGTSDD